MTQTIITPQTPSEDEYNIVVTFSGASVAQLVHVQSQLHALLGDAIWLTPAAGLHCTLMEIIAPAEYHGLSRQQHFAKWHEQYNRATAETIAHVPPFDLTFSQLVVSPRAIIVRTAESAALNDIRKSLLAKIQLPPGTKIPPDITHCSLARFNQALDLEDIIKRAKAISCNFTEHIAGFKLLKDLGPPRFSPMTIETYRLRG